MTAAQKQKIVSFEELKRNSSINESNADETENENELEIKSLLKEFMGIFRKYMEINEARWAKYEQP